jgi:hypothetical protein
VVTAATVVSGTSAEVDDAPSNAGHHQPSGRLAATSRERQVSTSASSVNTTA